MDINAILDMNRNAQALARELQDSLPIGLRCAVLLFTEGAGPVAFAHTAGKGPKMLSVLEQTARNLKEKDKDSGLVVM
jgi:hypothetical protein